MRVDLHELPASKAAPFPAVVPQHFLAPQFDDTPWKWARFERALAQSYVLSQAQLDGLRAYLGRLVGLARGVLVECPDDRQVVCAHLSFGLPNAWNSPFVEQTQTILYRNGTVARSTVKVDASKPLEVHPARRHPVRLVTPHQDPGGRFLSAQWQIEKLLTDLGGLNPLPTAVVSPNAVFHRMLKPLMIRHDRMAWRGYREFLERLDPEVLRWMRRLPTPHSEFYNSFVDCSPIARQRRFQALQTYPLFTAEAMGRRGDAGQPGILKAIDRGENPLEAYWAHHSESPEESLCPAWIRRRAVGLGVQRTGTASASDGRRLLEVLRHAGPDRFPMRRIEYKYLHHLDYLYRIARGWDQPWEVPPAGFRETLRQGYPTTRDPERMLQLRRVEGHLQDHLRTLNNFAFGIAHRAGLESHAGFGRRLREGLVALSVSQIERFMERELALQRRAAAVRLGDERWEGLFRVPVEVGRHRFSSLASQADLDDEARRMAHCVSGYADAAIRGISELVRAEPLDRKGETFTVEIGRSPEESELSVVQARGRQNAAVSTAAAHDAASLVDLLNSERGLAKLGPTVNLERLQHLHRPQWHSHQLGMAVEDLESYRVISPVTEGRSLEQLMELAIVDERVAATLEPKFRELQFDDELAF